MRTAQRGASGLFVAIILLLVAASALAILALSRGTAQIERGTQVSDRFKLLQNALQQYVAANGRLPCPANPTLDTGEENPVVPGAVCLSPGQAVPWKVIGVRMEDTIDPWGGKITYFVYTGAAGSLTQAGGASMVDCDLDEPPPLKGTGPGGLCNATYGTTEAEFLGGKGLQVTAFGVASANAAYVLVSHGPSGLGAFTTGGQQKAMPVSADEVANLNATGPFVAKAVSQGVGPEDAAHFDDLLAFASVGDLVRQAGRGARNWPDPILSSTTFDSPTLTAALGSAPSTDTGQSAITLPGVTVRAFNSGGSQNVSFDSIGGIDGIGGAGGGAAISSNGLEGVRLEFGSKARKLGITLNAFGVSGPFAERAELRFFDGATLVDTRIAQACQSASDPPASFTFDLLSLDFDNVEIRSLVTTPNGGGATQDSEFLLSAIATCSAAASSCQSPLFTSLNACP
ncbi:MAG: hypothetical protein ABIS67_07715 [Candidatus Eisenbacteria bacterium]